ncbi:hypothetical protein KQ717_15460, partial [Listeria monocytogenes]|nr:hypothetical protein [Listeria monocytogenes]
SRTPAFGGSFRICANETFVGSLELGGFCPVLGKELRDQGGLGMLLALGGILLYVGFRFQWKFALGAILSLVHDAIIVMGVLSFFQVTFD